MRTYLYSLLLFMFIGTTVVAQSSGKKIFENPELKKIAVLKDLAYQITTAEKEYSATSQSNAAAAKQKIEKLYAEYAKELENQRKANPNNKTLVKAIDEELKIVNSRK